MAARLAAYVVAGAYLVLGTVMVIASAIAGLWQDFARRGFAVRPVVLAAYACGTAAIALRLATRPTPYVGLVFVVLIGPGVLSLARRRAEGRRLRETAHEAVMGVDEAARGSARRDLLAIGRRSGRQPHVDEIVSLFRGAGDDAVRLRAATLLGSLSCLSEEVLDELRRARAETAGDASRATLHAAVTVAMRLVDPYGTDDP